MPHSNFVSTGTIRTIIFTLEMKLRLRKLLLPEISQLIHDRARIQVLNIDTFKVNLSSAGLLFLGSQENDTR